MRGRRWGDRRPIGSASTQLEINLRLWLGSDHVAAYAHRSLLPVEALILARYHDALSGRVLELGCGAGRLLGYLVALGGEVYGIDISPAMVEYCRRVYPSANVRVGDIAALANLAERQFDAVVAADNVLDVFDDAQRRRVLSEVRDRIAPGGVLVFSSHNLASMEPGYDPPQQMGTLNRIALVLSKILHRPLADLAQVAPRIPRRIRNRRRLGALEQRLEDHAILNDEAHDYGLLHYYIRRDDQQRQLATVGYELLECLDPEGRAVGPGESGAGHWLHYAARPTPPEPQR